MDEARKEITRNERRPLPPYLPREVAGRFRVLSLLGVGATGDVVEAYDLRQKGLVALKLLRTDRVDAKVVKRFFREATAMGRVDHPGVVGVVTCGIDANSAYYLAMELVRGPSLREILQRPPGRISALTASQIVIQVCEVLHIAHSLGVVHRDLKPDNLVLPEGWEDGISHVKVLDFGIAKIHSDLDGAPMASITGIGETLGTPRYMAPEQISSGHVDGRTDVYALGCILYEAVSGYPPIDGESHFAVYHGHMERVPQRLDDLMGVEFAPTAFATLVAQMMAKSPEDRPLSAAMVESDLRVMLMDLPDVASGEVPPPTTTAIAADPLGAPSTERLTHVTYDRRGEEPNAPDALHDIDIPVDVEVPVGGGEEVDGPLEEDELEDLEPTLDQPLDEALAVRHASMVGLALPGKSPQEESHEVHVGEDVNPDSATRQAAPNPSAPGRFAVKALAPVVVPPIAHEPDDEAGANREGASEAPERQVRAELPAVDPVLLGGSRVSVAPPRRNTLTSPVTWSAAELRGAHPGRSWISILAVLVTLSLVLALLTVGGLILVDRLNADDEVPPPSKTSPATERPRRADGVAKRSEKRPAVPREVGRSKTAAEVVIVSTPTKAEVYRGPTRVGVTPLTLTPDRGRATHTFLVRKKGHEPELVVVKSSELQPGEPMLRSVTLSRVASGKKALIELITKPGGAEVHEGSRFVGITPLVLDRPTWREVVRLDVQAEGYASRQILLALKRQPQVVTLDLTRDADPQASPRRVMAPSGAP